MKLHGQQPQLRPAHRFLLPRTSGDGLPLLLIPLSLGFHQRLRERGIQPPAVPFKIARDSGGKPLRDVLGQVVTIADPAQPEYVVLLERYHQRVAMLAVAESLSADPGVVLETRVPDETRTDGWEEYADRLFEEFEQSGFTAGDLLLLCREICRISNLLDEQLAQARANFSSPGGDGSS